MSEPVILSEAESGPMRRCIAAREPLPAGAMIRFVVGPDATLVPDLAGRLPGRGMWLEAERTAVARAVAKGLFARAARGPVAAPADLPERLEGLLLRRCLDSIGLARRSGEIVAGFDQVADWARNGRAAVFLEATDGAADGRRKLEALAGDRPVVAAFTRHELGAAIGRDEVVHIALAKGGHARRLLAEMRRFQGFRKFPMPPASAGGSIRIKDRSRS